MITMNEAIVLRIKELCKIKDINILRLSELSNVSQSTLNEIMQHRSKHPRIITITKIAKGFGMNLSEFFNHKMFSQISDLDEAATKKKTDENKKIPVV